MIYANFFVKQDQFAQTMGGGNVQLEIGRRHAVCQTLNGLSLSRRALVYQYSSRFQAILFDTKNVIDI